MLPSDPIILLSYLNTQLRDRYSSLLLLCEDLDADYEEICRKMEAIGYRYDTDQNRFR